LAEHPIFIPFGGTVAVRWACHSDGRYHAKEYYDANKECRVSLAALAQQMAVKGTVGKQPENGHRLKGRFDSMYELKPGDHRFMGFRRGTDFFLTNAARKNAKNQSPDYEFGLKIRESVLRDLG
jgi:hypothetical protein